jgi:DeoR/GlpR family transcriptional regulator of sugar metabolism
MFHARQSAMLDYLRQHPKVSVRELQKQLEVSRSTLWRDLVELEEQGEVVRVHGGVVHRDYLRGEPKFDRRRREAPQQKQAIARAAAERVPENASVYLDAGTTCLEIARQIWLRSDVHLFTHSIRLLAEAEAAEATLTCVGGVYRPMSEAVVGGLSLSWLEHLRFDVAFIAASGLSPEEGASTTETTEAGTKQAILKRARTRMLVADAQKWNKPAAVHFGQWDAFDIWITDNALPNAARRSVRRGNLEVICAKEEAPTL